MGKQRIIGAAFVGLGLLAMSSCGGTDDASGLPVEKWPESSADTHGPTSAPAPTDPPTQELEAAAVPPLTELEPGCLDTVESLEASLAPALTSDPLRAALDGTLAPMPLPGHEHRSTVAQRVVDDVDDFFLLYPNIIAPEERRATMLTSGFELAVDVSYAYGSDQYGVDLIEFDSAEGARAYFDVHAARICRDAVGLRPLGGPTGGVIYARARAGNLTPRAVTVVGNVEIAVTICQCSGAEDPEALAGAWLRDIAQQMAAEGVLI